MSCTGQHEASSSERCDSSLRKLLRTLPSPKTRSSHKTTHKPTQAATSVYGRSIEIRRSQSSLQLQHRARCPYSEPGLCLEKFLRLHAKSKSMGRKLEQISIAASTSVHLCSRGRWGAPAHDAAHLQCNCYTQAPVAGSAALGVYREL